MEINPFFIKQYLKSHSLRRTKTDKLDAKTIASYLADKPYLSHQTSFYQLFSLKQLTRMRNDVMKQRSRCAIQLTNVLDCIFPEFKPFFGGKFSVTARYILSHYSSPEKISRMNSKSFEVLRQKSRGRFSMSKFVTLKNLAKNTIGSYTDFFGIMLHTQLDLYTNFDDKINELDAEITKIVTEFNPPTLSIKGIGAISAAVIISEFGDFSRFANPSKMLAFAGLEPGYFQSGTKEYGGRMVKHGSPHLRSAILNCCRSMCLHNEVFASYYFKKTSEGKAHMVAMSHMAKKLIRLIYTLETKCEMFDPQKMR